MSPMSKEEKHYLLQLARTVILEPPGRKTIRSSAGKEVPPYSWRKEAVLSPCMRTVG